MILIPSVYRGETKEKNVYFQTFSYSLDWAIQVISK